MQATILAKSYDDLSTSALYKSLQMHAFLVRHPHLHAHVRAMSLELYMHSNVYVCVAVAHIIVTLLQ